MQALQAKTKLKSHHAISCREPAWQTQDEPSAGGSMESMGREIEGGRCPRTSQALCSSYLNKVMWR